MWPMGKYDNHIILFPTLNKAEFQLLFNKIRKEKSLRTHLFVVGDISLFQVYFDSLVTPFDYLVILQVFAGLAVT